jgi:HEAT repeat protein
MEISYVQWHDGEGYDLEALGNSTKAEQTAAVVLLGERLSSTPNWRDIEALGVINTPLARARIRLALMQADFETRLRAAKELDDLGETVDLESVIIEALRGTDLSNGLSQAIDAAEEHPSPRIQETLLDLALNGNEDQRIQCAALALYLGGKADEAFDWNHRPFFLRFGEEDRKTQIEAYQELCQRLGVTPKAK